MDISVASILMLLVLSWLYPLLALLISVTTRGGALFSQKRIGYKGKVFRCYKFRTMYINKEADIREASTDDERITRLGNLLRATYIDELPQLWNVLRGEMSIVGPRPHMLFHHRKFCRKITHYNYRHEVKPGITGLAQVKGYHGAVCDDYRIIGRTRLDLFYMQKASLKLDMIILAHTAAIMLTFNKKRR